MLLRKCIFSLFVLHLYYEIHVYDISYILFYFIIFFVCWPAKASQPGGWTDSFVGHICILRVKAYMFLVNIISMYYSMYYYVDYMIIYLNIYIVLYYYYILMFLVFKLFVCFSVRTYS